MNASVIKNHLQKTLESIDRTITSFVQEEMGNRITNNNSQALFIRLKSNFDKADQELTKLFEEEATKKENKDANKES